MTTLSLPQFHVGIFLKFEYIFNIYIYIYIERERERERERATETDTTSRSASVYAFISSVTRSVFRTNVVENKEAEFPVLLFLHFPCMSSQVKKSECMCYNYVLHCAYVALLVKYSSGCQLT